MNFRLTLPAGLTACTHAAMATEWVFHLGGHDPIYLRQAATEAFALIDQLEGNLSFYRESIAFGKLDEKIKDKTLPLQQVINIGLMVVLLGIAFAASFGVISNPMVLYLLLVLSLIYGVLFVMPIGGADMPVVISLLNSFTGVAAAMGGFLYDNKVMLFGGILVGSAGTLLTVVMCKAMNRSLTNVLIGNFGGGSAAAGEGKEITGSVKEISGIL